MLTEAVEIGQFTGRDTMRQQPVQKPEISEHGRRLRQQIDADTERLNHLDSLEDIDVMTIGMQRERGSKPADAAAGDCDLHAPASGENAIGRRVMALNQIERSHSGSPAMR